MAANGCNSHSAWPGRAGAAAAVYLLMTLVSLLGIFAPMYLQAELNKVWQAELTGQIENRLRRPRPQHGATAVPRMARGRSTLSRS